MWKLDHKGSWVPKNWCFKTVVLEKILQSSLDSKEIKPVNPKGNWLLIFIGRTDAEAEAPILGKIEGQEEKGMTENEMVGRHHWLNGLEFEQTLGGSEGQGSLVCCSPWVTKRWTRLSNWTTTPGQEAQRRPQRDSRDHHPPESGSASIAALLPCPWLCYLHSTLLSLFYLNWMFLMVDASKVLMARPWDANTNGTAPMENVCVSGSFPVFFPPTLLALNCWDFIHSGLSSPRLAPKARHLLLHVHFLNLLVISRGCSEVPC